LEVMWIDYFDNIQTCLSKAASWGRHVDSRF